MSKNTPSKPDNGKPLEEMTAADFERASRAASTRRENAKDVRYFVQQGGALPASPAVMVAWLTKVASQLVGPAKFTQPPKPTCSQRFSSPPSPLQAL